MGAPQYSNNYSTYAKEATAQVYIFDLRPGPAKQNEHKASKILKKISDFMTEGRREEKYVQQAVVEWQKELKLPNMLGSF